MKRFTKEPLGQVSAFGAGAFMLFMAGTSFLESVHSGVVTFKVKNAALTGDMAGVLIALCVLAGGYLVASALPRVRK